MREYILIIKRRDLDWELKALTLEGIPDAAPVINGHRLGIRRLIQRHLGMLLQPTAVPCTRHRDNSALLQR